MTNITPVLLAGGSGTRLWPFSRKSYPKQFSNILGKQTLFQQSVLRLISSECVEFTSQITLTNSEYRFIVAEQLQEVGVDPGHILIEPEAKNTAPAILAASLFAFSKDPEAILLVAPSDHIISDLSEFHAAVKIGLKQVQSGKMVTFGIHPTHPETGYGYLELAADDLDVSATSSVKKVVEKPELNLAKQMLKGGNFLWNAGIFLFKAKDMIDIFELLDLKNLNLVRKSVETAAIDLGFLRLNPEYWRELTNISIDYAVMEKADNLVAVPYSSNWTDLGDWNAVWNEYNKDETGVASSDGAHSVDCSNTLLLSENSRQQLVGLGLDNIIAIAMPDAVLVMDKRKAQDVRKVVELLKVKELPQAEVFPKDHRPWGWFESLIIGDRFQVKKIFVNPGAALSLQSHHHRSEHWVVVEGTAKVTVDEKVILVTEGESVYIPLGATHRMENPGKMPMVLI